MNKKIKSIAATVAALSTFSLTGCDFGIENIETVSEQSYIDESHSIHGADAQLVIVDGFSEMDRSIASSIRYGYHFLNNMISKNGKVTLEHMLKFNLGKDFGISKGDRYVFVLDTTIEKYSEAISYYDKGQTEKFRQCYRELVLCNDYLNVSDLVEILCSKVNSYSPNTIVNFDNYQFDSQGVILDGTLIKGLVPDNRDSARMNNVIDLFKFCYNYQNGEYSFEEYANTVLFSVPDFISSEMNKIFNPIRICVDEFDGQIYAYNTRDISYIMGDQKDYLKSNYNISNWEFNEQCGLYFAYNDDGFGYLLQNGCECEKYIEGIDYVKDTLLGTSRCDYATFDNFKFEGFYDNYLACSNNHQLKK